ncbi:MAG: molybdopterin-guanine dinucleotide biosynthesis protein B [Tissierellia bacterium]|nr:molybdopterin-guanine dinucleotide biosynthesis protein B [Tissierellia bacterium]
MKIISVIGITLSGKTTTIENIIKELRKRKYTVGSVKEIHFESFTMEIEGSNTDRHSKAGAELVTARGMHETDILFPEKLNINKILGFYSQDFVILEGVSDTIAPKIIAAHDIEGIEDRLDDSVFAISGKISIELSEYKGLPVINAMTSIEQLVDLIEEKAIEYSHGDEI